MNKISKTTLGDLIEFQRGYDLPKSDFKVGKVPVISSNGILGYHNQAKVKGPGITIGRSGTVGLPHYINEDFFPHNTALFIKDFKGNYPKYIFYLLKTLSLNDRGSGSGVPTMNRNHLHPLKVSAHLDFNTQQKIASVLSALDSKIELNNRINAELEAMAKTLYDYWFVQFDFPDKNGKPYKTNGGKMVWNEELKREIPEGWEVEPLFKAMDVQYGFPFSTSKFTDEVTDKPVIRIRDILENTISTYTTEEVDDKYRLKQNDLLIGMDGNFHLNFWDKDGAYLNQRSVRIRAKKDSEISNLQAYFELKPYIKARENNVSRTTVGHLSDKDLKRLFLISPSRSDLFEPKNLFENSLSEIISNRLQNQKLTELRDWLLPMLMNGQVKVMGEKETELSMAAEPKMKYGK